MENLSGALIARLADNDESYDKTLIDQINGTVKPPRLVEASDVYIRAMYIVSDQINSQGGCFAPEDLDRLAEMMIDSPVMIGHKRDSLPVARNFKAVKVDQDGHVWIKSYFYWMKDSEGAENLKNNIDGGIYKECSISFLFRFPECSICGHDIRECRHIPFREYETESGRTERAHFKYRRIEKVLETSLVFRGAIPETKITDKLSSKDNHKTDIETENADEITGRITTAALFVKTDDAAVGQCRGFSRARLQFGSADQFDGQEGGAALFVFPHQPGLTIRVIRKAGDYEMESTVLFSPKVRRHLEGLLASLTPKTFEADFLLFATKGKERRDGFALVRILEAEQNLHRLRLRLCDVMAINGQSLSGQSYDRRVGHFAEMFQDHEAGATAAIEIDMVHPRKPEKRPISEMSRRYNFGLEIIAECENGSMIRHILRPERPLPARVEKVTVRSRRHNRGLLVPLGRNEGSVSITCSKYEGMEEGAVVLLVDQSGTGRQSKAAKVLDILPGTEVAGICTDSISPENPSPKMFVYPEDNRLIIRFDCRGNEYRVVIHHFSRRLLGEGRRFIADMEILPSNIPLPPSAQPIKLDSISGTGGIFRLCPSESETLIGPIENLFLRPVLIDSQMRHLFHTGYAADHHAGL